MEKKTFICIICPLGCNIEVELEGKEIVSISGNNCDKGKDFVTEEIKEPKRIITTTVKVKGSDVKLLPVKLDKPVPKEMIFEIMKEVRKIEVSAPVKINEIICENILGSGANLVATRSLEKKQDSKITYPSSK